MPANYPVDDIILKFKEIISYPFQHFVSRFSHRSVQISLLTLRDCMKTGRYKDVFFDLMTKMRFDGYFRSGASDESETRDGWDKHYMTRDAVFCLKRCDELKIAVPDEIRRTIERMKLCCSYYYGKPTPYYDILEHSDFFKDICILDDEVEKELFSDVKIQRAEYNTRSLRYYFASTDEEDLNFIRQCIDNLADLKSACEKAIEDIQSDKSVRTRPKNIEARIEFIKCFL